MKACLEGGVEKAALIRLRPIIMTTAATIVAMIPLLFANGPGAVSRFHIGLVISTGLGIGTFFTLFMVPVFISFCPRITGRVTHFLNLITLQWWKIVRIFAILADKSCNM